MESATITLIYKKKGSAEQVTNYRPISILPTSSKILESAFKEQVVTYLSDNKLICDEQSAYHPCRSTQTSLHGINDRWNSALVSKQIVATCSLDLAKGFDTISHHILLTKLKLYGFSPFACKWFTSYLSIRTQKVKLGHHISDPLPLTTGVPRSNSWTNFISYIYINDLPYSVSNAKSSLYADDSTFDCSGQSAKDVLRFYNHLFYSLIHGLTQIVLW